jgi:general secretion pathway protein H
MPISATGSNHDKGFTLVELMVVLVIVGLMSAAVMFALPDPRGRLVDDAERFAARALAARDLAIVTSRATRVRLDASGYAFDQRKSGAWAAMAERPFGPQPWQPGVIASTVTLIVFDPAGGASPQTQLVLKRDDMSVSVNVGADGGIRVGG